MTDHPKGQDMMQTILVFLGSVRDSTPPRPARLGLRVAKACLHQLARPVVVPVLIDPLDFDLPRPFKPVFAYAAGKAPAHLDALARQIAAADGYVMISPEYNHSMSPALADLLNHFGSSLFAYKPCSIVTYSAGQWGGTRAAVNMRSFLAELGCLPVSAMIHIPKAQEVFDPEGQPLPGVDGPQWAGYLERSFQQLFWWAEAAQRQRISSGMQTPAPFLRDPSQRNAP